MKTLDKFAMVLSKIAEICHWVGAALSIGILVSAFVNPDWFKYLFSADKHGEANVYGFNIELFNADGTFNIAAVVIFAIAAILILSCMAMIFRNIYLIIKTAGGQTWFSKGVTPFQKDITRMIRELGIFSIFIVVIGCVMSIVSAIVLRDASEVSVNFSWLIVGIFMLCLSNIFGYGEKLQDDVDGLL